MMAIMKNGNFRVSSHVGGAFDSPPRRSLSGDEEEGDDGELWTPTRSEESSKLRVPGDVNEDDRDDDVLVDEDEVVDSGMESDELNLLELGEPSTLLCQVGNQSCSISLELYDLQDFGSVLSLDAWNECLSEEERFALAEFLPDMDQETFSHTLRELFSGQNFHFSSPLTTLFNRLKGGLCDPRIVLYSRGLNSLKRREHYHHLRRYHNSMLRRLLGMRDAWQNCAGYGIEERLRLLNIQRCQMPLAYVRDDGNMLGSETDSESRDSSHRSRRNKKAKMELHAEKPSFDFMIRGNGSASELVKLRKEKMKGVLKVATKKVSLLTDYLRPSGQYPSSSKHHINLKTRAASPPLSHARNSQAVGHGKTAAQSYRLYVTENGDDIVERGYEMSLQGDWNRGKLSSIGLLKAGKKQDIANRFESYDAGMCVTENYECYVDPPYYQGKGRKPDPQSINKIKKTKVSGRDWKNPKKDQLQNQMLDGSLFESSPGTHPMNIVHEEATSLDHSGKSKKWKAADDCKPVTHLAAYDMKVKSHKSIPAQTGESYNHVDHRSKPLQGKNRNQSARYDAMDVDHSRKTATFAQNEETESDSANQDEEDGEINLLFRKFGRHSTDVKCHPAVPVRSAQKSKKVKKLEKAFSHSLNETAFHKAEALEALHFKGKQKGKTNKSKYLEDKMTQKDLLTSSSEKLHQSTAREKKRKGMIDVEHPTQQSFYPSDYGSGMLDEYMENVIQDSKAQGGRFQGNRRGDNLETSDAQNDAIHERSSMGLVECSLLTKKPIRKVEAKYFYDLAESLNIDSSPKHQTDEPTTTKKKGKRKADASADTVTLPIPELIIPEPVIEVQPEEKPEKKPFTPITPTIHTGFSFSIVHLLSAVRKAIITTLAEDTTVNRSAQTMDQGHVHQLVNGIVLPHSFDNLNIHSSEHAGQNNLPGLTVCEIVNQVRSYPGDPCILETQEPLQDLVRGVLKIFSSRTAPLGAKCWKPLVLYEKSNKSWSWVGPVVPGLCDNDAAKEETSPEAWGIPHKMLVKLVDAFANWLKSGQDTLQQIGSLPEPPASLLSNVDEKERFKDLRAQKSLSTINPSSDEVRAYFQKEELLRYSVPDRAFSYTAADGKKSIVAPLRRGGGKPTSKARDHFMLKHDRPPHVTILCLVRDAAARLPGSIGTRADVCTLIRDSQFIVEDVSDAQVNQVVSGALDRLHYERDPCVQFDNDRKLWVYLHRDREEEDFEDDGTSSTKKWKRQKKDPTDQSDAGAANDTTYHVAGELSIGGSGAAFDYDPEHNFDASSIKEAEKLALIYDDMRPNTENISSLIDTGTGNRIHVSSSWNNLGVNSLNENSILCQENSNNKTLDDDAFGRERPVGILSTTFL